MCLHGIADNAQMFACMCARVEAVDAMCFFIGSALSSAMADVFFFCFYFQNIPLCRIYFYIHNKYYYSKQCVADVKRHSILHLRVVLYMIVALRLILCLSKADLTLSLPQAIIIGFCKQHRSK